MNKLTHLPIINSIILVLLIIFSLYGYLNDKSQIAYVDNVKLFNGFNMTKDISTLEERKIKGMKKHLDSLFSAFQSVEDKESDKAKQLQAQIARSNEAFQKKQDDYVNNLNQQVWSRLNQYIKEYSTNNNLEVVLGTSGDGNLMFAKETLDITDKIIEYSNFKYEGNLSR